MNEPSLLREPWMRIADLVAERYQIPREKMSGSFPGRLSGQMVLYRRLAIYLMHKTVHSANPRNIARLLELDNEQPVNLAIHEIRSAIAIDRSLAREVLELLAILQRNHNTLTDQES